MERENQLAQMELDRKCYHEWQNRKRPIFREDKDNDTKLDKIEIIKRNRAP
jgi:hypothetical protein